MYHQVEKELVFAGTWFLQKGVSGKVPLKKNEYGKEFLFSAGLESNSPGFLELESQKKGTQKVMHNQAIHQPIPLRHYGSTNVLIFIHFTCFFNINCMEQFHDLHTCNWSTVISI